MGLLYFALLIPRFEEWPEAVELAITKKLNGLVLMDPLWDWSVVNAASRFWLLATLLVIEVAGLPGGVMGRCEAEKQTADTERSTVSNVKEISVV
ncbi:hypothetical protein HYR69_07005 [Candidatus Sumerlaeota bacterium]|nr:hypothetical protein [Candidatus Sumerlaeota bacterium]